MYTYVFCLKGFFGKRQRRYSHYWRECWVPQWDIPHPDPGEHWEDHEPEGGEPHPGGRGAVTLWDAEEDEGVQAGRRQENDGGTGICVDKQW